MTKSVESENYQKAVNYMKDGQFTLALSLFIEEIQSSPGSLPILVNIASCYYMVHDFMKYKQCTLVLLNQYETLLKSNPKQDLRSPLLALVRLLEELGEVGICYRLLKDYNPGEIKDRYDWKLISHKLRLNASFPADTQISELYQFCNFLNIHTDTLYTDLQGALLLADWTLFGEVAASNRLQQFLKHENTQDYQRRLLVFDHIFEALKMGKAKLLNLNLLDRFVYLEVDPFEQIIWDIFLVEHGKEPNREVNSSRADGLSPMGSIKVHYLLLQYEQRPTAALEIRKKITFLLSGLGVLSRELFFKNWIIRQEKIEIQIKDESAVVEGREYCLKKSPSIRALFEELSVKNEGSTEKLIRTIWKNNFDEISFSRLRVLVTRGNAFLKKTTGLNRSISLSKNNVQLNANIKIIKYGA